MKKLYFLNEEEKQRILKLHKSHQVGKFWLNEQHDEELDEQSVGSGVVSTVGSAAAGAGVGAGVAGFLTGGALLVPGAIIGGVGGAIYGLVSAISSGMDRATFNKKIQTACTKDRANAGVPTMSESAILETVEQLHELIKSSSYYGTKYATEESSVAIQQLLTNVLTLPDFCHIASQYQLAYGTTLLDDLTAEFYSDDYHSKVVRVPLLKAVAKSMDMTKKAEKDGGSKSGTGDAEWEKAQLDFYKTYPCLTDVARATRAKNAVVVQNPSQHKQIMDKSQGKQATITDETTFLLDGTYQTATDENRGEFSGKFECSPRGEKVLLYPGKFGMGGEGGIYSKWPCLGQPRKDGTAYTEIDSSDNNQAIMADEERKTHPIFSGYPEGDIYFSSDGTFLTENDFNNDLDKSGRFKCKSKGRIFAAPFKGVSTEPIKTNTTTGGGGAKVIGGMGIVSASAADVTEILKCANIGGTTIDQTALNKLYEYIKNNKK
jgi:hypothetical protein